MEINTKSIKSEQSYNLEDRIRLSIDGLINQYVLQKYDDKHVATDFPRNTNEFEKGYRKETGTSIAVRIRRNKDYLQFEEQITQMLNSFLSCSPVPIYYNGGQIGGDFNLLKTPFGKNEHCRFPENERVLIEKFCDTTLPSEAGIHLIPINLSEESGTPHLKGQLLFVKLNVELPEGISFDFKNNHWDNNQNLLRLSKREKDDSTNQAVEKSINIDLGFALESSKVVYEKLLTHDLFGEKKYVNGNVNLIHNGINVPNINSFTYNGKTLNFSNIIFTESTRSFPSSFDHKCFGVIYLQDELIPDLSVSRDVVKSFGFHIYSSLYFATKSLNKYAQSNNYFRFLDDSWERYNHGTIASDYLVKNGCWDAVNLFNHNGQMLSINDLKAKILDGPIELIISYSSRAEFLIQLKRALLEINFKITLAITNMSATPSLILSELRDSAETSLNEVHPSLFFIPFSGKDSVNIVSFNFHINTEHSFTKWLIVNQSYLMKEFKQYYVQLVDCILHGNIETLNQVIQFFRNTIGDSNVPTNLSNDDYEFIPF